MDHRIDVLGWRAVLYSWMAACAASALALVVAVCGQALGGLVGGCSWIGISLAVDHPVWALVNQPTINFAGSRAAHGYWLGSSLLPIVLVAVVFLVLPRPRRFALELFTIQACWALVWIPLAWLPLLDRNDGHLARWLHFNGLDPRLLWLAPVVAAVLLLLPTLRLASALRLWRRNSSRRLRLVALMLHLWLPSATWVGVTFVFTGNMPIASATAVLCLFAISAAYLWNRFPPSPPHPFQEIGGLGAVLMFAAAVASLALLGITARPVETGLTRGYAWTAPSSTNNIREHIEIVRLGGAGE